MTQDDVKLTRELLAPLRERPVPVTDAETLEDRRRRMLPSVRAVVRQVPLRRTERRWRTIVAVALPAAAAVALAIGATGMRWQKAAPAPVAEVSQVMLRVSASSGRVTYDAGGETQTLTAGDIARVPARGRITTAEGAEARLESNGLEVTLRERTEVGVPEGGLRSLRVKRGGVRCVVPPLGPDRQFSVVTPDATVVVHGTVFSVQFNQATKQTCVAVEEGVVSVRHASGKTWLEAGDSWGCESPTTTTVEAPPTSAEPLAPRTRAGTLAVENALFQSAFAAERRGHVDEAQAKLRELLAKFPDSPLAPEARATLTRLKNKQGAQP